MALAQFKFREEFKKAYGVRADEAGLCGNFVIKYSGPEGAIVTVTDRRDLKLWRLGNEENTLLNVNVDSVDATIVSLVSPVVVYLPYDQNDPKFGIRYESHREMNGLSSGDKFYNQIPNLVTLVEAAVEKDRFFARELVNNGFWIGDVPSSCWEEDDFCVFAINKSPTNLSSIPNEKITAELVVQALEHDDADEQTVFDLLFEDYIPQHLMLDPLVTRSILEKAQYARAYTALKKLGVIKDGVIPAPA